MEAINAALGAESAMTLQCKTMVGDYVKQLLDALRDLPVDEVRGGRRHSKWPRRAQDLGL